MARLGVLSPALILVLAITAGSAMDATIKYLTQTNHVLIVTLGRYVFGAIFSLAIWWQAGKPAVTPEMWRAHALRGFVIAGCATTFFWALTILPLAEAVTLSFIYPLIVPFMAAVALRERVRPQSLVAAIVGFAGVIVATQGAPPVEQSPLHAWGVAAVLVSAGLFSIAMVLLRQRAQTDGAPIVGLMTSLFPAMIVAGPAIAFAPPPNWSDWPLFLLMGALAATFMYLMARAYAKAEAQVLAPIHYVELIFATIFGIVIFNELPRIQIFLGAALIIAACLYVTYEERRVTLKRKEPA
ncbi:MAG TPA: DMT family transporter [Candidatus Binatia bacterium]|nr:DMT family transporter [Candidatus Binatia bacterium]